MFIDVRVVFVRVSGYSAASEEAKLKGRRKLHDATCGFICQKLFVFCSATKK